jgi:hypothetical protein
MNHRRLDRYRGVGASIGVDFDHLLCRKNHVGTAHGINGPELGPAVPPTPQRLRSVIQVDAPADEAGTRAEGRGPLWIRRVAQTWAVDRLMMLRFPCYGQLLPQRCAPVGASSCGCDRFTARVQTPRSYISPPLRCGQC